MYKILLLLSFSLLVLGVLGQLYRISKIELNQLAEESDINSVLPSFEFRTISNETFTNKDIIPDKALILMYMDPTCEACIDIGYYGSIYATDFGRLVPGISVQTVPDYTV